MTCPKCKKVNRCWCSNCNPNGDTENVVILDKVNEQYICFFCDARFSEDESVDYEWEEMKKEFIELIDAELAFKWLSISEFEKQKLEKKHNLHSYAFGTAVLHYFNRHWQAVGSQEMLIIRRNMRLQKVLGK
jgi:hypothetical protein